MYIFTCAPKTFEDSLYVVNNLGFVASKILKTHPFLIGHLYIFFTYGLQQKKISHLAPGEKFLIPLSLLCQVSTLNNFNHNLEKIKK